ncbi:MAG: alkaline phosphatase family protein [Chloroflexi bacterium]|nr:alkaline phosphatase family protein [Chloroflexota bacterium]
MTHHRTNSQPIGGRGSSQRRATRALVMVMDGLRPDFITPDLMPNLHALAARGVRFDESHAIVPTVTRVNAATLATGTLPRRHGLPANLFSAPRVDPSVLISIGEGDSVAQIGEAYGVFREATLADTIGRAGGRTAIVSSGTRGSAQMLHPRLRERGDVLIHPTLSTGAELAAFEARLGPLPERTAPNTERTGWFARAAAEIVIPEHRPDLLLVWHDDPDTSQHRFGLGHPASLRAIRDADEHLGALLDAYRAAGLDRDVTIAVVSDHGYVQVDRQVDVATELAEVAGDEACLVATNGGAALLYAPGGSGRCLSRLVGRLYDLPDVAAVFSGANDHPTLDGTLPLGAIGHGGPLAPDLLVTFAWDDGQNEHGWAGRAAATPSPNLATHGGASRWETRNTLILAGAGIESGAVSTAPAGLVDLTPTLLTLLGLTPPAPLDGRVLAEALSSETIAEAAHERPTPAPRPAIEHLDLGASRIEVVWSDPERRYLRSVRRLHS